MLATVLIVLHFVTLLSLKEILTMTAYQFLRLLMLSILHVNLVKIYREQWKPTETVRWLLAEGLAIYLLVMYFKRI